MAKKHKVQFKVVVRVGNKIGAFVRGDNQPILTLGAAHAYADECLDEAHEVIILREEVVARIPGRLSPHRMPTRKKTDDKTG